jgi:leucyl aminopeptidase
MVTVNAQATDNVGVVLVNYFVDNAFVATDVTAPNSFTWDSRTVPNGSHVLMVASADARGLYSISSVTVNVAN